MKRISVFLLMVCIIVSLALSCTACAPEEPEEGGGEAKKFVPVLRFAISSDIHVRSGSDDFGSAQKLTRFIGSAYEYAEAETGYNSLDGIFVVGDLTQDGKTTEYDVATDLFNRMIDSETYVRVVMGNHEMHAFGQGDARFTAENIAKSTARFNNALGYGHENHHEVINGYHFIFLANDTYESCNYFNEESLDWLRGEIDAAMADDASANKPVFVMQHEPPMSEVRGFTGGDERLGELLKNYPRVVDFSGHTHRSILDPQSIWQDGFTAIGTGGLAYLGYNLAGHPTLDNNAITALDMEGDFIGGGSSGARTGAMYYIVEVDAEQNIRLKIYDILTESFYGDPITFKVGEGEIETFTPEREEKSVAPIFPSDGKIEVISTDYNLPKFSFTTPTGGDLVQYYKIELTKEGESWPDLVFYRLGCMHNAAKNETSHLTPIRGHRASGKYTVKIYAYNCWGKSGLPLEGEITIAEKSMVPDILYTEFSTGGTAVSGEYTLGITSSVADSVPVVSYNEELGKNIATFDGGSGYKFANIKDYYDEIIHSLSIETYFRAGETDSDMAIGSNTNSAGFGLSRRADGSVSFNFRYNNGASRYLSASTAAGIAPVGEWVHAVAVFNARGSVSIYINGEAATLYDEDGNEIGKTLNSSGLRFQAPNGSAAALIVGGDISKSGSVELGFIGDIATFNIFSRPLTAGEAAELFSAYGAG